jgi:hypothetical protein
VIHQAEAALFAKHRKKEKKKKLAQNFNERVAEKLK